MWETGNSTSLAQGTSSLSLTLSLSLCSCFGSGFVFTWVLAAAVVARRLPHKRKGKKNLFLSETNNSVTQRRVTNSRRKADEQHPIFYLFIFCLLFRAAAESFDLHWGPSDLCVVAISPTRLRRSNHACSLLTLKKRKASPRRLIIKGLVADHKWVIAFLRGIKFKAR